MQSIWRSARRPCRRRSIFPITSGLRLRWSYPQYNPSLPNPVAPVLPDNLLNPDPLFGSAYGHWNVQNGIGLGSVKQVQLDRTINIMDEVWMNKGIQNFNLKVADDIWPVRIFEGTSHRDGSIYKRKWKQWYAMDIADRNETVCELSKLPRDFDCYPDQENCIYHGPSEMIQIFSLRLAKTPINSASIQLYGYMAARDELDGKLNYVFNHSRNDPVIVQQGSLIKMTGPKRGIIMLSDLLFEFDMRIKTGEKEEDDIQLIDGITHHTERIVPFPITVRINGNSGGAVDMSFSLIESGVEVIIEVVISEVQSPFHFSLSSIVYVAEVCKEVQLFDGPVDVY
ncbi:hypothetical protein QOZ80_5AG0370000 [Eleusine coracana subsp. coracana]|nr:hypothetical protein QOZ80_5AG0370000 [Eleusine coracana subsp. coracana]